MSRRTLSPLKIVFYYLVFSLWWILLSDLLLTSITKDPEIFTRFSIIKGWLFVLLTSALLYWLMILYSRQNKQAEDELKLAVNEAVEEKTKTEAIIAALGDALSIQDVNYRILYQNQVSKDIYGDHAGEYCYKAYQNKDQVCRRCHLTMAFSDGRIHRLEQSRATDKGVRYYDITASPVRDFSGNIIGGIELVRDITERKQMDEALRQSKDQFRKVVENSPLSMALVNSDGTIEYINIKAIETFGYLPQDIPDMDRWWAQAYPDKAYRDEVIAQWMGLVGEALLHNREIEQREYRVTCKDGSVKIAAIFGVWVAERVLVIFEDVTERKRAEGLLKDAVSRLKATLESTADGILVVDNQGRISAFNEQFARLWHIPQALLDQHDDKKALGFVLDQLKDPDLFISKIKDLYEDPEEVSFDVLEFKDGRVFERLSRPQKIDEHPVGRVWSFRDVTDRNKTEKELEKYRDHLEDLVVQRTKEISVLNDQLRQSQKLEAVGILAGGIAHEFSNILTTMKGAMYLIQKKLHEDSPVMKYAGQVVTSINKATELSQGLLTFSRKQMISVRPVHFNEIIRHTGKMLTQLIGEDIELSIILCEKTPSVMADMNQIEQVLINLATNARDAMPDGGRLTISTDVMKIDEDFRKQHGYGIPGEYVVLTVSDSGTGMEEAIRRKIFEPFFTTKVVGKGSGLGLAVTYGIVKQHNGFIDVESVPGEGTTFKIYFPAVEAEVIQPTVNDRRHPVTKGAETVLLAEDDEDVRSTMSEILSMTGYTVLEARDGEEAVSVFMENKDRVQLVFLDVRMPKKDGRAVYEAIKIIGPQTKFLFISGYTEHIIDPLAISEESINFISKASLPHEILEKIREVLDKPISGF